MRWWDGDKVWRIANSSISAYKLEISPFDFYQKFNIIDREFSLPDAIHATRRFPRASWRLPANFLNRRLLPALLRDWLRCPSVDRDSPRILNDYPSCPNATRRIMLPVARFLSCPRISTRVFIKFKISELID